MEKKRGHNQASGKGAIAGELSQRAARKQLLESLVPLQWLARKNGFKRTAKLLEDAIDDISSK